MYAGSNYIRYENELVAFVFWRKSARNDFEGLVSDTIGTDAVISTIKCE